MMNRLTITGLLRLSVAVTIALLSALVLIDRQQLSVADSQIDQQETLMRAVLSLKDARYHVIQIQQFLTDVGATADEGGYADADSNRQSAIASLNAMTELMPLLAPRVDALRESIERLHSVGVEMAQAYVRDGQEAGNIIMKREGSGLDDASATLASQLNELTGELNLQLESSTQEAQGSIDRAITVVLLFSIVVTVVIAGIQSLFYFRVIPPLNELNHSMHDIATGSRDLNVYLETTGRCEIGQIAESFNTFVANMRQMVMEVVNATEQLAQTGSEVSRASKRTMEGMGRLTTSAESINSIAGELNDSVHDVAASSGRVAESAALADQESHQGQTVVSHTASSIGELAQRVEQVAKSIHELGEDINNIDTIIEDIQGIADQTNLLALNAAIESARAGEQGRGFSVVADEVRSLSKRTQAATQEIVTKIHLLQGKARDAVETMSEGRQLAEGNVSQAAKAGESLTKITASVATISQMSAQIASSTEIQGGLTEELKRKIADICEESDDTIANARNMESVSLQMESLLGGLSNVVGQFHVADDSPTLF